MNTPNRDPKTLEYIAHVNALERLDRDEELALASRFVRDGDRRAADRLIRANLRNVVPMALRYRRLGVALSELIAQGNLGLMTALDRFEPERGLRFATYANYFIRAEMLTLVNQHRSLVRSGRSHLQSRHAARLQREHQKLRAQHGDSEQVEVLLAQSFGRNPEEIRDVLKRLSGRDSSLDAPASQEGDATLGSQIADDQLPQDHVYARDQLQKKLDTAVAEATATLNERERYIVDKRLMADEEVRMSLADLGRHFGVTRERARQLEERCKGKLRVKLGAFQSELGAA